MPVHFLKLPVYYTGLSHQVVPFRFARKLTSPSAEKLTSPSAQEGSESKQGSHWVVAGSWGLLTSLSRAITDQLASSLTSFPLLCSMTTLLQSHRDSQEKQQTRNVQRFNLCARRNSSPPPANQLSSTRPRNPILASSSITKTNSITAKVK